MYVVGGRGSEIIKNRRTSFMDVPQVSTQVLIYLSIGFLTALCKYLSLRFKLSKDLFLIVQHIIIYFLDDLKLQRKK